MDEMAESLKCPHGADVYALPNGEPYFPAPCAECAAVPAQRAVGTLVAA